MKPNGNEYKPHIGEAMLTVGQTLFKIRFEVFEGEESSGTPDSWYLSEVVAVSADQTETVLPRALRLNFEVANEEAISGAIDTALEKAKGEDDAIGL